LGIKNPFGKSPKPLEGPLIGENWWGGEVLRAPPFWWGGRRLIKGRGIFKRGNPERG